MEARATCLNCMDGRVQLPVLTWIKANYPVDFVDVITEAGMDGVLAKQKDISEILRSIKVSVDLNRLKPLWPSQEVFGLWVNDHWQVELVS